MTSCLDSLSGVQSRSHIGCGGVGGGARESLRGTVRLLGRSPYAVRGAAGTAGCSGMSVYCGLKQTLVMIFSLSASSGTGRDLLLPREPRS